MKKLFLSLVAILFATNIVFAQQISEYYDETTGTGVLYAVIEHSGSADKNPSFYSILGISRFSNGKAVIPEVINGIPVGEIGHNVSPTEITIDDDNNSATPYVDGTLKLIEFKHSVRIFSKALAKCVGKVSKLRFYNLPINLTGWTFGGNYSNQIKYDGIIEVPRADISNAQNMFAGRITDTDNIKPITIDYYSTFSEGVHYFNVPATWGENSITTQYDKKYNIQAGHIVILNSELILNENTTLINEGVLRIAQGGELINNTDETDFGVIEVEAVSNGEDRWTLIGAPFTDYSLNAVVETESDIAVSLFDYENGQWSSEWATTEDDVSIAESFFAWPFGNESIIFNLGLAGEDVKLNFDNFSLNKSAVQGNNGYWLPLANPYTFKLDISEFLGDNTYAQGEVSYRYNGETWTVAESGVINVTEGFFVNLGNAESKTVKFEKDQRYGVAAKANTEREFVRLAMLEGERSVELLFAQNDDANESYDIYDANKLFSPAEIAEPYFLTDGIALVKEEVNTLPYYATMNVRSYEGKEVKFKADYIPEGLSVSIIDGEEIVDLTEGAEYTTEIASGENADRFKVLVKKNVGLADVEELDVRITNSNRNIAITAQEEVKVEVYNTLGQKVYETNETDFVLSGVASGAYVVKVQGAKAAKSQKIIVE